MTPGPLRVGLAVGAGRTPEQWSRILAWVERAEALGLDSVWLPEGHFRPDATASPLVTLAAFAARTRRLRLATTSLLLPIHHPFRVAAEVAALDVLSGGRVLLGLGRGFRSPVFRGYGVAPGSKRDRFDAALDAIVGAWSGVPVDLTGTAFEEAGTGPMRLALRPVQRPHPPLVVAAFGRKGLLQAARRGLPYLASPLETLATLEENYAIWRDHRQGEPCAGAPAVPVMRTVHVTDDDAEAARVLASLEREVPRLGPGAPPALARAAGGAIEDRVIVGGCDAVAQALERHRERLGMDLLVVRPVLPDGDDAPARASLDRLVSEVLPRLGGGPASTPPPLPGE